MRKRTKEEKRRIVEESLQSEMTVAGVARAHGVGPGQIFEWRRAYREGRLAGEPHPPALLPVRISETVRSRSTVSAAVAAAGVISIELTGARIEIHGAADSVSLGIVLECLAP